jgi:hypothetical protein
MHSQRVTTIVTPPQTMVSRNASGIYDRRGTGVRLILSLPDTRLYKDETSMSRKTTTKYGKVSLIVWASTRQGETEARKEERLIQEKGRLMINNSSHACVAKSARLLTSGELIYLICQNSLGKGQGRVEQVK